MREVFVGQKGTAIGDGFAKQNSVFAYTHAQLIRPPIGRLVALVTACPDSINAFCFVFFTKVTIF